MASMLSKIRKEIRLRKIDEATPTATKRDPKKTGVAKLGTPIKSSGGSGEFEESPVDLAEVGRAYFTDSYIRRAVDKHSALMFKNGWELSGKNDQAVEYVWTRLKLMAESTKQSIDAFLQEASDNFILYGNSYVVKARAKGSTGLPAGVTAVGYTGKQPIAGYFVLPAHLVQINRDDNGEIVSYQQTSGDGGEGVEFAKEDIVHFPYRRPSGRAYGVPFIFNALDDVKILRQIEENVIRLIYRNLFPLYLYKVGIDKAGFEATDDEIDDLREELRTMPVDGALVVPERHNVEVVGAEGSAIDASGYLKYFRERVFSGLGVSDTIMGISGTANKSTSDNQSSDLNDSVKDFQRMFADIFKFGIINEILFEGGYDPTLNADDEVNFVFSEIELDAKIKRENHLTQLYLNSQITFEEMREWGGWDTRVDESRLYINMFAAINNATGASEGAANQSNNQDQPENQHGKQDSPKPKESRKSAVLSENLQLTESSQRVTLQDELQVQSFSDKLDQYWVNAMEDVLSHIDKGKNVETINSFTTRLTGNLIEMKIKPFVENSFATGFKEGCRQLEDRTMKIFPGELQHAVNKHTKSFEKLMNDVSEALSSCYEQDSPKAHVIHAFTANQYRLRFISKRISYESFNYGVALAAERASKEKVYVQHQDNCCTHCLTAPSEIVLSDGWRNHIPPHHTGCECTVVLTTKEAK